MLSSEQIIPAIIAFFCLCWVINSLRHTRLVRKDVRIGEYRDITAQYLSDRILVVQFSDAMRVVHFRHSQFRFLLTAPPELARLAAELDTEIEAWSAQAGNGYGKIPERVVAVIDRFRKEAGLSKFDVAVTTQLLPFKARQQDANAPASGQQSPAGPTRATRPPRRIPINTGIVGDNSFRDATFGDSKIGGN